MLLFLCERYVNTKQNRLEGYSKRFVIGASDPTRTGDLLITNELHYQLCYTSIIKFLNL